MSQILCLVSDSVMFWTVQSTMIFITAALFGLDKYHQRRAGRGGVTATVIRCERSMGKYYALYAAVNGLLVALTLSVKAAENYRVVISLLDTALCFYIFVLNQFMRNKIVQLTGALTKVETR